MPRYHFLTRNGMDYRVFNYDADDYQTESKQIAAQDRGIVGPVLVLTDEEFKNCQYWVRKKTEPTYSSEQINSGIVV